MDLRNLNWGGPGYPTYDGEMKVSDQEKAAQQQQALNAQWLSQMMQRQFSQQQSLLNGTIIPQLTKMATNPQGFGLPAISALRSQMISMVGSQLQAQQQGLRQQFATQNMAGLGSGVQAALGANLAQGAAGQEATGLQNIAIANEQAKQQQQQFGLQGLAGATQLLGAAPQTAGLANQALGQSWQMAYNQAQQAAQGGFWTNLARAGITAAATAFGGPMAGMAANSLTGAIGLGGQGPTSAPFPGFQSGNLGQPYYANQPPSPLALPPGAFGQMPALG